MDQWTLPEVWIPASVGLALYLWSTTTLGRCSLVDRWIFARLQVLVPTSTTKKKKRSRLKSLKVSMNPWRAGATTKEALKNRESTHLWMRLDLTTTLVVTLSLALAVRWGRFYLEPCTCDDIDCWWSLLHPTPLLWWLWVPALYHWWNLAMDASRLDGSRIDYLPSNYVTSILVGYLFWTFSQSSSSVLGDVSSVMEELATRCFLWIRLLGSESVSFEHCEKFCRGAVSMAFSLLAFALHEPIQAWQTAVIHRWYVGGATQELVPQRRLGTGAVMGLVAVVTPAVALSSFFLDAPYIRVIAGWTACGALIATASIAQQDFMLGALPSVAKLLSSTDLPSSDVDWNGATKFPFQLRGQRMLRNGSKLAALPLFLFLLLAGGHLVDPSRSFYPEGYGGVLTGPADAWKREHVNMMMNSTSPFPRFLVETTECVAPQPDKKKGKQTSRKDSPSLVAEDAVTTSSFYKELLELQQLSKLASSDDVIQAALSGNETSKKYRKKKDRRRFEHVVQTKKNVWDLAGCLVSHPFVTSRIVATLLDVVAFGFVGFWLLTFALRAVSYRRSMKETKEYMLMVIGNVKSGEGDGI